MYRVQKISLIQTICGSTLVALVNPAAMAIAQLPPSITDYRGDLSELSEFFVKANSKPIAPSLIVDPPLTLPQAEPVTVSANLAPSTGARPSGATMPEMDLLLEIVVNGQNTNNVVPVAYRNGHYYLSAAAFKALKLPVNIKDKTEVAVDQIHGLDVTYASAAQQLLIDIPADWLPTQHISTYNVKKLEADPSTLGLLFNYDLYTSRNSGPKQVGYLSAYTEQRLLGGFGVMANNGVYRHQFESNHDNSQDNRYMRYDTHWHYNDEQRMWRYAGGDVITGALSWTSSVRLGGLQLERNFSTNPDLITYPLPQFAGQAKVPSAVDLYIGSFQRSSTNINPGPFTIDTMPYINGAGDATIVVTDVLGRQVSTSVSFYIDSEMLQAGLSDFSLSAGALRKNYGIKSFDYGEVVVNGSGRYGLTNWLTVEGRAEGAKKLGVGGVGVNLLLDRFGVLSGSYSGSYAGDGAFKGENRPFFFAEDADVKFKAGSLHGDQASFGYTYTQRRFSLNLQRVIRSEDYGDLSSYKSGFRLNRRTDRITGSTSLAGLGSIGAGYFDIRSADNTRLRLANLSYSHTLWGNNSLYAAVNREIGGRGGYSAQFIVTIPFEQWGMISLSANKDEDNKWQHRALYSRPAPVAGGVGWDIGYAGGDHSSTYKQASLDWIARKFRLQGGIYGDRHSTYWGELSGSLVAMDSSIYASKLINDAFALISTDGYGGIPVSYENQLMGTTDSSGYLLIPTVTSYYRGKYEIDPLELTAEVQAPLVEQHRSVRENSGLLIEFPLKKVSSVSLTLLDEQGEQIPRGSVVHLDGSDYIGYTGWDGMAYLEGVTKENHIMVIRADNGQECQASFTLPNLNGMQSIDAVTCVDPVKDDASNKNDNTGDDNERPFFID